MNLSDLQKFLLLANQSGYASGKEHQWIKEQDGSTSIRFSQGTFAVHDNYFGGEPYGGRMVVSYKEKPVWIMVYYGWVIPRITTDAVYFILRNALKRMPEEMPLRGPKDYQEGAYHYVNRWEGSLNQYSGEEQIFQNGRVVYQAQYFGGLIDIVV